METKNSKDQARVEQGPSKSHLIPQILKFDTFVGVKVTKVPELQKINRKLPFLLVMSKISSNFANEQFLKEMKRLLEIVRQNYRENKVGWMVLWSFLCLILLGCIGYTIEMFIYDKFWKLGFYRAMEYAADEAYNEQHIFVVDSTLFAFSLTCITSVILIGGGYLSYRNKLFSITNGEQILYTFVVSILYAIILNLLIYWVSSISLIRYGGWAWSIRYDFFEPNGNRFLRYSLTLNTILIACLNLYSIVKYQISKVLSVIGGFLLVLCIILALIVIPFLVLFAF